MALVCLAAWSCGGWRRVGVHDLRFVEPRRQAQVWRGGKAVQLHGLRLTADSISGVPFIQPPSCDSCRVSFPRAEVDSVRIGMPEHQAGMLVALGITAAFLFWWMLCSAAGCEQLSS